MRAPVIQHGAPTCSRWRHAQAEKAQRGLGQHCTRHPDGRLHDQRLDDVGQDVAAQYAQVGCSQRPRRLHKLPLFHRHYLRPDQPRVSHPTRDGKREDEIENTRTEERDKRDGQQNSRQSEECIRHIHVQDCVRPSAIKPGRQPRDQPDRKRERYYRDRNHQRDASTVECTREDVTAKGVGPEPVAMSRRQEPPAEIELRGVLRREPGRKYCTHQEDGQQQHSERRQRLLPDPG